MGTPRLGSFEKSVQEDSINRHKNDDEQINAQSNEGGSGTTARFQGNNSHDNTNLLDQDDESFNMAPIEERESYKFKNDAIYSGQWKLHYRHGYGT